MVSTSGDAIKRVVEAFERSDWSEIDVRAGDVRVHLSTASPGSLPTSALTSAPGDAPVPPPADAPDAVAAHVPPVTGLLDPPPGAQLVVSPTPGILWRSPEPGFPPFADVGDTIAASATVCIVEVMKLMNHIKAGVGGEVVGVYCENGVAVRKGQPLFAIVPSGSSS